MKLIVYGMTFWLLISSCIAGDILITEIMANPDGSDTDREWVEIYNKGNNPIDLTGWRFYENGIKHHLTKQQGSFTLDSNDFAIICEDKTKFLSDYPGYTGNLYSSSFSLKNTGEEIGIKDDNFNEIDLVFYEESDGQGYSLELIDPDLDNSQMGNWFSKNYKGTPGELPIEEPKVKNVPEFSTITAFLVLCIGTFFVWKKRK